MALILIGPLWGVLRFIDYADLTAYQLNEARAFYLQLQGSAGEQKFLSACERGSPRSQPLPRNQCLQSLAEREESLTGAFSFRVNMGAVPDVGIFLFLVSTGLAASFAGNDWSTGQIQTTLQWEPRRVRVFLGKILVAMIGCTLLSLAVLFSIVVFTLPVVWLRGSLAGLNSDWWAQFSLNCLRFAVTPSVAAVLGVSLSTLTRQVPATLTLLMTDFYAEVQLKVAVFGKQGGPVRNLMRFLNASVGDYSLKDRLGRMIPYFEHSTFEAGFVLLAASMGLLIVAAAVVRVRDV